MGQNVTNKNKDSVFNGPYAGRDMIITLFQDSEREFVVTHNANIRPVSYFTGRETELQELRRRIEVERKSILVCGRDGIGKTQICRKLFEEYIVSHNGDERDPFQHIGYIDYNGDMGSSLENCLKYKEQVDRELNQELAWRELEYLASDGKLLLFVNNIDKAMDDDPGLQRLKSIPGAVVLTSRQTSFGAEFEPYRIESLSTEQCRKLYEKIRFENSEGRIKPEEFYDLEHIIDKLAGRHTYTIELLAHMARTRLWTVKKLREELEKNGFRKQFRKDWESFDTQKFYDGKTVFLSYNWHDGETADRIDKYLSGCPGITVNRDVREIGPWKSIRKFMMSIRKQDYAILIISDYYLKSKNCMFEVTEIMKEPEYGNRMLLVVEENKIYDPLIRAKYIKYWQEECDKMETAIRELNPEYAAELVADLKRYKSIASSMGEFLSMVADRNNPDIREIEKEIEKAIFKNK